RVFRFDQVTPLVLAKEVSLSRQVRREWLKDDTSTACHRHLGNSDEEPAIRQIVAGGNPPGADLTADKIAVAPLGGEVDQRGRTGLAALDFAQVKGAPQRAASRTD